MVQTKIGGQTYKQTMINKYGSYENWIAELKKAGTKGGHSGNTTTRGFGSNNIDSNGMTGKQRAKKYASIKRFNALKNKQILIKEQLKEVKKYV